MRRWTKVTSPILGWDLNRGSTLGIQLWRRNQQTSTLDLQQKTRQNVHGLRLHCHTHTHTLSLCLYIYIYISSWCVVSIYSTDAADSVFILWFFLPATALKVSSRSNFCVNDLRKSFLCLSLFPRSDRPIKWNAVSSRLRSYRYCCMDALHGRLLNGWRRS